MGTWAGAAGGGGSGGQRGARWATEAGRGGGGLLEGRRPSEGFGGGGEASAGPLKKSACWGRFLLAGRESPALLSRLIMPYVSSNLLVAHASCGTSGPSSTSKRSARVSSATLGVEIRSPGRWLRTVPHFVLSFPSSLELRASRSVRARVRLALTKLRTHPRRAGGSGYWLPQSPLRCACATARYQGTIL